MTRQQLAHLLRRACA
ncbi:hypothetical protein AL68_00954, partial [Mycobacterium tuberculosis TKK_03_0113]